MNNMEKVAELLDVKLGEKFYVNHEDGSIVTTPKMDGASVPIVYRFTEQGLYNETQSRLAFGTMNSLITGDLKIFEIPFEPSFGEKYYSVYNSDVTKNITVFEAKWDNSIIDILRYNQGMVFRTEEEANSATKTVDIFYQGVLKLIRSRGGKV